MQRSLIDNRSGQQRVAVALKCDSKSAKAVLPLIIEVALQLDFVDRWLIRFGIASTVSGTTPSFLCGRSPRKSMAPRWCCHGDTKVLFGVLFLRQTQLAGARDSFGAPLDLEFAKDLPIVSLDRVQGEEEPLANLVIGESLSNEPEDL